MAHLLASHIEYLCSAEALNFVALKDNSILRRGGVDGRADAAFHIHLDAFASLRHLDEIVRGLRYGELNAIRAICTCGIRLVEGFVDEVIEVVGLVDVTLEIVGRGLRGKDEFAGVEGNVVPAGLLRRGLLHRVFADDEGNRLLGAFARIEVAPDDLQLAAREGSQGAHVDEELFASADGQQFGILHGYVARDYLDIVRVSVAEVSAITYARGHLAVAVVFIVNVGLDCHHTIGGNGKYVPVVARCGGQIGFAVFGQYFCEAAALAIRKFFLADGERGGCAEVLQMDVGIGAAPRFGADAASCCAISIIRRCTILLEEFNLHVGVGRAHLQPAFLGGGVGEVALAASLGHRVVAQFAFEGVFDAFTRQEVGDADGEGNLVVTFRAMPNENERLVGFCVILNLRGGRSQTGVVVRGVVEVHVGTAREFAVGAHRQECLLLLGHIDEVIYVAVVVGRGVVTSGEGDGCIEVVACLLGFKGQVKLLVAVRGLFLDHANEVLLASQQTGAQAQIAVGFGSGVGVGGIAIDSHAAAGEHDFARALDMEDVFLGRNHAIPIRTLSSGKHVARGLTRVGRIGTGAFGLASLQIEVGHQGVVSLTAEDVGLASLHGRLGHVVIVLVGALRKGRFGAAATFAHGQARDIGGHDQAERTVLHGGVFQVGSIAATLVHIDNVVVAQFDRIVARAASGNVRGHRLKVEGDVAHLVGVHLDIGRLAAGQEEVVDRASFGRNLGVSRGRRAILRHRKRLARGSATEDEQFVVLGRGCVGVIDVLVARTIGEIVGDLSWLNGLRGVQRGLCIRQARDD